jgi:Zn-dependent metalloprotease
MPAGVVRPVQSGPAMKNWLCGSLVVITACGVEGSQDDSAWNAVLAKAEGPVAVEWGPNGSPAWIYGSIQASATGERGAREFLAEHAAVFAVDGATLAMTREVASPLGTRIELTQQVGGVPVWGAAVTMSFGADNRITGVTSTYAPNVAVTSGEATITRDAAITIARGELEDCDHDTAEIQAELFVYSPASPTNAPDGGYQLAWRTLAATDDATWEQWFDAGDGRALRERVDINRRVIGSGKVFRINAVVATQDNALRDDRDAASAVPSTAYMTVPLERLQGNGRLDGTFASSAQTQKRASNIGNIFNYDRSQTGFSETMAYYYLDFTQAYIQSLGFSNVNNRQQVFAVNRYKKDNSFYSPGTKYISYGTGGVDDAEDAEVIIHEYGHSIQDNIVPGFGSSAEAGAMGEGFGDYLAASVGAQQSNGFQDACVAEWDAVSYSSSNPPCLRRVDSTKHYPESIVGEVHDDGEIWSAALWQIRSALGAAKADRLILQHHFLIAAGASFNSAGNALIQTALNLGYTGAEVDQVRAVLLARGFAITL